ncbi:M20 peptidase aminoacylase family protein [Clostridium sp. AL.422]|uniref:M20 peptidase aminoacylase family protein n=1 Tax=Clostridium TaxID=1485 RepID=UPI00293DA293|nr:MULTISPECIES: M20 peptidase aminoacylase family protein [unclassified Clostridium]MDV4151129.1 M20 peptidase aminoacylase family protein [Clostridium sp. AL.422]
MTLSINEKKLSDKLIKYRRELHENPELSMKEYETTKRIRQWLKDENIKIIDLPLEVGIVAEIEGGNPGPIIALRADIDALPIIEETGLDFSSKNHGVMHACGHDFHTSAILGAAILIKEYKEQLHGKVRIIFQPAEENAKGAKFILDSGALDNVEAIFGMHNKPDLPIGTIGIRSGALMASVDRFEIDVIGVGGHAGIPERCIDPIIVASEIVLGLQTIVSRSLSPFNNAVISITQFNSGNTWNVIPEKAGLEGTVRTFQNEVRKIIPDLMKRKVEGIAKSYGAKINFRWYPYLPGVENDEKFTEAVTEAAIELGYKVELAKQSTGGEDFALYQSEIPGFFIWMGVEGTHEWHHPSYNLNEEALIIAAKYFSNLVIKVLS